MTQRTADFPETLKKTLYDLFDGSMTAAEDQYKKVFDVCDSDDAYEEELMVQGPDEIPQVAEGGPYERIEMENIRTKRYTWLIFKGERKITREALADNKYPQIVDTVKQFSEATSRTVERLAAGFYIGGLSGAELLPNDEAIFLDNHVVTNPLGNNPGFVSNKGIGKLSNVNIKQGRILGRRHRDEHGSIAPVHYSQLIVPPDLDDDAFIQKLSALNPDNADNAKNVVGQGIKEVVVLDYLAEAAENSATAWFLRDPKKARNKFFWRDRPTREVLKDQATGDHVFRVYFRCGVGAPHYAGLFGSDGTGSEDALGATIYGG